MTTSQNAVRFRVLTVACVQSPPQMPITASVHRVSLAEIVKLCPWQPSTEKTIFKSAQE